jgi:exonuclease III
VPRRCALKVVTWNLNGCWGDRSLHAEAWEYLLEAIRPDLALVQEVRRPPDRLKNVLWKMVGRTGWGTAVFAKDLALQELRLQAHLGRIVAARVVVDGGRQITVASLHAPVRNGRVIPNLRLMMEMLQPFLAPGSFMIGGDLNTCRLAEKAWPRCGHAEFFDEIEAKGFINCFWKLHGREEQTFFRSGQDFPFQDDHIIVSPDLGDCLRSCQVLHNDDTLRLSDHIPLVTEFGISC